MYYEIKQKVVKLLPNHNPMFNKKSHAIFHWPPCLTKA